MPSKPIVDAPITDPAEQPRDPAWPIVALAVGGAMTVGWTFFLLWELLWLVGIV